MTDAVEVSIPTSSVVPVGGISIGFRSVGSSSTGCSICRLSVDCASGYRRIVPRRILQNWTLVEKVFEVLPFGHTILVAVELPDMNFIHILGPHLCPTIDLVVTLHAHQVVDIVVGVALGTVELLFAQPGLVLGVDDSCRGC